MKIILCMLSLFLFGYFSEKQELINTEEIETTPSITIHVEGAVLKEGDYVFEEIVTIEKALENIGTLENASLEDIPLQNSITPELLVYVPFQGDNKISLNYATKEELQTIKGIGPKKAEAIIEGRPYTCIEDLMNVSGIGEKTYRNLRVYFCL